MSLMAMEAAEAPQAVARFLAHNERALEELGAQDVGDEFGLPFQKNSVPECAGQRRRRGKLGAQFLVAAGCDHEQPCAGGDAVCERIVRCGVAGV